MKKNIAILGSGPSGLSLTVQLLNRKDFDANIILIEKEPKIGGLAASFEYDELYLDYGSHRLHPATDEKILKDITKLIGSDLIFQPRNGRIRLLGSFVKFPLNPFELFLKLPLKFTIGIIIDTCQRLFSSKNFKNLTFSDVLLRGLGKTICNNFYFPYAKKLWGINPEEISATQAQKRISANTIWKMIKKILSILPGFKSKKSGKFYYPKKGYGQICQALYSEVIKLGGTILLSTNVDKISISNNSSPHTIFYSSNSDGKMNQEKLHIDFLFSTIPITILSKLLQPKPPKHIIDASENLRYRSMILAYFIFGIDQFTKFDAHYFPESNVIFSRISEPKNYSQTKTPIGKTAICLEIPCQESDQIWSLSEIELKKHLLEQLKMVGLPNEIPIKKFLIKYIKFVYPIYNLDYETKLNIIDTHLINIPNLISLGRQGLFAHDNTHHTIEMAYRANECLKEDLIWDSDLWNIYRQKFNDHVVED